MKIFRGEQIPSFADKVLLHYDTLYCEPELIKDGDTIYCDTHHLYKFKEILNRKKEITIITHNSDHFVCDGDAFNEMGINTNDFTGFKFWYAQNCYSIKENVFPIPIGFENTRWETTFGPKTAWLEQVSKEPIPADRTVYLNCNRNTNLLERQNCYEFSSKTNFITTDSPNLDYVSYLRQIKNHKFTLSPRGNGLDCHRTWEILMMKRVPILKREGRLEDLYERLPVLFVDEWEQLNTINLEEIYNSITFEQQDYLQVSYWKNYLKGK